MEDAELPIALRQLQPPSALDDLHHHHHHHRQARLHTHHLQPHAHTAGPDLTSPLDAELDSLDPTNDTFQVSLPVELTHDTTDHGLPGTDVFDGNGHPALGETRPAQTSSRANGASSLSVLPPIPPLTSSVQDTHAALDHLQSDSDFFGPPAGDDIEPSRTISTPPNLAAWRRRLFNVDETITLTEEEYVNVQSHDEDLILESTLTEGRYLSDIRRIFLSSTMSTRIDRRNDINESPLSPITGTAASRAVRRERPSLTTRTRRSASGSLVNAIYAT